jgi:hypothetical protein
MTKSVIAEELRELSVRNDVVWPVPREPDHACYPSAAVAHTQNDSASRRQRTEFRATLPMTDQ